MSAALFAALLLQAPGHTPRPCPTVAPPPAGLSGWAVPQRIDAGRTATQATRLSPGVAVAARLPATQDVRYAVPPEKPGDAVSHGGLFAFTVATSGRYRLALGSGAWVDVLSAGTRAPSVAHGHGPACSGIRKMVDFDLIPGRYILQIAGSSGADLRLMVAKLPG